MTTVDAVKVRPVSLTPARPVETAAGVLGSTPLVLIDVTTSDGVVGRSYLRTYTPLVLRPLAELVGSLGSALVGAPATPESAAATLGRHLALIGTQGLTGIALAGLDMALWDAAAVAANVPLVTLLGGAPAPVPAYASLRRMSPEGAAEDATEAVEAGFTAVKVKLGRGDLNDDLATIHAVRAAVGTDTALMVDYNQSLSVAEALDRVPVLDELDLAWIEEPTTSSDVDGNARIAAAARTPIQLGENWLSPEEAARSVAAGACDLVTFDAQKIGGVTGWLRARTMVGELPVSSHTFGEVSLHLLGVTPTARWLEYLDHVSPLLSEPLTVNNGLVTPFSRPGIGLHWDESAVSSYAVHGAL